LYFIDLYDTDDTDTLLNVEDINLLVWTEGSAIHY